MKQERRFLKPGISGLVVLVCATLVICVLAAYRDKDTEYEDIILQVENLLFYFEMETSPDYKEEIERNPDRIDFEYIDLEVTDQTYEAVTVINHFLFNGFDGKDGDAIQRANEMGRSYQNQLTVSWIEEEPWWGLEILEGAPAMKERLREKGVSYYYDLIKSDTAYTRYRLSYTEAASFCSWFGVELTPKLEITEEKYLEEGRTDFTDVAMRGTKYTDQVVAVLNQLLFEEPSIWNNRAVKKAGEYGLSEENPMTAEWLLAHPKEAMEIKNAMENYGEIIYNQDTILKKYREIERLEQMK